MTNQIIFLKINSLTVFVVPGFALSTVPSHTLAPYSALVHKTTSKVDFALDNSPGVVLDAVKIFAAGAGKNAAGLLEWWPVGGTEGPILHKNFESN